MHSTLTFMGGAGALYRAATETLRMLQESTNVDSHGNKVAIGVLLLSAASIEAFLNEVGDYAQSHSRSRIHLPKELIQYGDHWQIAESCNASTRKKYKIALECLSHSNVDKGSDPWQSFMDLFLVRDSLMHMRNTEYAIDLKKHESIKHKPIVHRLAARGLIEADLSKGPVNWLTHLQSVGAATWGCSVSQMVIQDLLDKILESIKGESNAPDLGKGFQMIWGEFISQK